MPVDPQIDHRPVIDIGDMQTGGMLVAGFAAGVAARLRAHASAVRPASRPPPPTNAAIMRAGTSGEASRLPSAMQDGPCANAASGSASLPECKRDLAVAIDHADLPIIRLRRASEQQTQHRAGAEPLTQQRKAGRAERGIGDVLRRHAPSGPTQAQRLATQIDDDVIAMPNAPVCRSGRRWNRSWRVTPSVFLVLDSTR